MSAPKAIGSTWVMQYKGKEYPVVLCDDSHPPPAFIENRPNPFLCPAILLGKHIFVWVKVNDLQDFEPGKDYAAGLPKFDTEDPVPSDEEHVVQEKLRRRGFKVDALLYQTAEFWCNYIRSKSEQRKMENEARVKRPPDVFEDAEKEMRSRMKRRKDRSESRTGAGTLMTPQSMPRKKAKSGSGSGARIVKSIETIDDSDDESVFVRDMKRLSDPFQPRTKDGGAGVEEHEDDDDDAQLERIRNKNIKRVRDNVPPYDYCTIFVGPEYTPFTVSRVAVGKCDSLSDWEIFEEALGSHIKLYENTDIEKDQFKPIDEYLKRGDFAPKFSKTFINDRFEDAILLTEDRDEAAENVVVVYHIAAKIGFEDVQKLCLRKLRVLDSLSPGCLLILARIMRDAESIGSKVEEEMLEWLATRLSTSFWKLVETSYLSFSRVMRGDVELSQRVFDKMAANPMIGSSDMGDD